MAVGVSAGRNSFQRGGQTEVMVEMEAKSKLLEIHR